MTDFDMKAALDVASTLGNGGPWRICILDACKEIEALRAKLAEAEKDRDRFKNAMHVSDERAVRWEDKVQQYGREMEAARAVCEAAEASLENTRVAFGETDESFLKNCTDQERVLIAALEVWQEIRRRNGT